MAAFFISVRVSAGFFIGQLGGAGLPPFSRCGIRNTARAVLARW